MKSIARTIAAFERQNRLVSERGRQRHYLTTPIGREVIKDFVPPLAEFIRGDLFVKPNKPPANLGPLLYSLDPEILAAIGLAPLLDGWARGWNWEKQSYAGVCLEVGREFEAQICKDLDDKQRVLAGHWLVDCATSMDYFDYDKAGFPIVAADCASYVRECRERLLRRHPHQTEPPAWTGWRQRLPGRMPATFVRDWRPETRAAVERAFGNPDWEHARAVNALQRVPLEIDPMIAHLVELFGTKIEDRGWKRVKDDRWLDQWSADYNLIEADLAEAHCLLDKPFWLGYNTDKRGRVNPLQHLNYGREDHVRALFRFHNGMKLGKDELYWLAVHVANCEGSTDKQTWDERVNWVKDNYCSLIEPIGKARDPGVLFEEWRKVDKPFAFVAACREYVAAKADPENFITHLPVGFDHTCSGIQHLSMICRDEKAGALVSLIDSERPQDVYTKVAAKVREAVYSADGEFADWWKKVFATKLNDGRKLRKLLKRPVMTFGYAAGNGSRQQQIGKEYYGFEYYGFGTNDDNIEVPEGAFGYLAKQAGKVIEDLLPQAAEFMQWTKELANHAAERGEILTWVSPTNFPVRNAYHVAKFNEVSLQRGGVRIRFKLADGATDKIDLKKAMRSVAANFVHSMDASHLVRVVNAATDPHEGINDILVVHDCFAAHAPNAVRLNQLICRELAVMYHCYDAIAELCSKNPSNLAPPQLGNLDPLAAQSAEWVCI